MLLASRPARVVLLARLERANDEPERELELRLANGLPERPLVDEPRELRASALPAELLPPRELRAMEFRSVLLPREIDDGVRLLPCDSEEGDLPLPVADRDRVEPELPEREVMPRESDRLPDDEVLLGEDRENDRLIELRDDEPEERLGEKLLEESERPRDDELLLGDERENDRLVEPRDDEPEERLGEKLREEEERLGAKLREERPEDRLGEKLREDDERLGEKLRLLERLLPKLRLGEKERPLLRLLPKLRLLPPELRPELRLPPKLRPPELRPALRPPLLRPPPPRPRCTSRISGCCATLFGVSFFAPGLNVGMLLVRSKPCGSAARTSAAMNRPLRPTVVTISAVRNERSRIGRPMTFSLSWWLGLGRSPSPTISRGETPSAQVRI